jgi:1-acyl-sn-glycerol-3-phosphate acyltransferase
MKFLQRLYRYYFYFLIVIFFLTLYPVFYYFLKEPARHPNAQKLRKIWSQFVLTFMGVRYKVIGKEHLDRSRTYIICGNHSSHLDIVLMNAGLPLFFAFMAKAELGRIPLFGIFSGRLTYLLREKMPLAALLLSELPLKRSSRAKVLLFFPKEELRKDRNFSSRLKKGLLSWQCV